MDTCSVSSKKAQFLLAGLRSPKATSAMTLLEVILALAIFMIVGGALFRAAQEANWAAHHARDEQRMGREMESIFQEILASDKASNLESKKWVDEEQMIEYNLSIEESELSNQEGDRLDKLYEVTLEAENDQGETRQLQRLIYEPLFYNETPN